MSPGTPPMIVEVSSPGLVMCALMFLVTDL